MGRNTILSAKYRLPYIFDGKQDFITQFTLLNENTDAYDVRSAAGNIGIEKRFNKRLTSTFLFAGEGGKLADPDSPRGSYYSFGLPISIRYNKVNNILDATQGYWLVATVAPYQGHYNNNFWILRSWVRSSFFIPFYNDTDSSCVLALSGTTGNLRGANVRDVPPTLRFYSGGGNSVRGYDYQSIGARNSKRNPLGGSSIVEVSGELRWKFNENWGLVVFTDGGMVYTDSTPELNQNMQWGAGVGVRYYTSIGPIRLDIATPLNPRKDDSHLQLYVSIGQSF